MPSAISFTSATATKPSQHSIYQKRMSVTQTYIIAHQAREKLAKEANCPDHNLHRLVCHANMLDTLIFDLAHAEEEQDSYLNKLCSGTKKPTKKSKVERWTQVVRDKLEEESGSSDGYDLSEDDDSSDEEYEHCENRDADKANGTVSVVISSEEEDSANMLQEEHARLALERVKTRQLSSKVSKHAQPALKLR